MTRAARRRAWRSQWSETDWGEALRQQAAAAEPVTEQSPGRHPLAVYLVPAFVAVAMTVVWAVLR